MRIRIQSEITTRIYEKISATESQTGFGVFGQLGLLQNPNGGSIKQLLVHIIVFLITESLLYLAHFPIAVEMQWAQFGVGFFGR